uniref:HAT C-terminal dimerisation domain-containing protein n=1 Tax=Xiphophorus maculatus TaxID=8083 RepID=A0A3B5R8K2_XIPMA
MTVSKCCLERIGFNLASCLKWKKLDFTTALICASSLRPASILTPKFVITGLTYWAKVPRLVRESDVFYSKTLAKITLDKELNTYCSLTAKCGSSQGPVRDLIIGCNLPLSIVENKSFRHFLTVVDSNYSPICHRTMTSKIEDLAAEKHLMLKTQLSQTDHVSVTVDIWSDRKMRGFLGITVHWIQKGIERLEVKSKLLAFERFKGSHTGERICEKFEAVSFTVCFPTDQGEEPDDNHRLDDPELWHDLPLEDQETVGASWGKKHRLQCFWHLLLFQSYLSSAHNVVHTSTTLKAVFEAEFGERKSITASVITRWNSTVRQVKAVLQCEHLKLCAILEKAGHKKLLFTIREWNLLKEMVDILKPFEEATDLTQGEKIVTISAVVPSVLSFNHHLEKLKPQVRFLNGLVSSLQASLNKRFLGIFIIYLKAAALDPAFSLLWVEHHVLCSQDMKTEVTQKVKGKDCIWSSLSDCEDGGPFAAYCKRQKKDVQTSPALQLSHYLHIADGQNALLFWAMNMHTLPSLFNVATRVLAVAACSAPVERVFSYGGIILRAQMTDRLLVSLVFCKCNAE